MIYCIYDIIIYTMPDSAKATLFVHATGESILFVDRVVFLCNCMENYSVIRKGN